MPNTEFTVIGKFTDGITSAIEDINIQIRMINSQFREIDKAFQQVTRTAERIADISEDALQGPNERNTREARRSIRDALLEVKALEKVSQALQSGVSKSAKQVSAGLSKIAGFINKMFSSSLEDEIADIQARGSLFGALQEVGYLKPGEYNKAKQISAKLQSEIAKMNASSSASNKTVNYLTRGLSDNLLPELLKSGKTIDQSAQELAKMYEQIAYIGEGIEPAGIVKSITKALNGGKEAETIMLDFFEMNGVLRDNMIKNGFFATESLTERLKIFRDAMNNALPPESINAMKNTLSGGMQAINDNLFDMNAGVFSFAKDFSDDDKKILGVDASNAREIIAKSLSPFLNTLAGFLQQSGVIMARVAIFYDLHFAPHVARTTKALDAISAGEGTLTEKLGKAARSIINEILSIFEDAPNADNLNFFDQFIKGFNSLGDSMIKWDELTGRVIGLAKEFIGGIVAKLMLGLLIWNTTWALAGALTNIVIQLAITNFIPFVFKSLFPITLSFFKTLVFSVLPAMAPIIAISALVAGVLLLIVRHREKIGQLLSSIQQIISGFSLALQGPRKILMGAILWPIGKVVSILVSGLKKIPLVGRGFGDPDVLLNFAEGMMQEGINDITTGISKAADSEALDILGSLIGDMGQDVGSVINAGVTKVMDLTGMNNAAQATTLDTIEGLNNNTELIIEGTVPQTELLDVGTLKMVTEEANFQDSTTKALAGINNGLRAINSALPGIAVSSGMSGGSADVGSLELSGDVMAKAKAMFEKLRSLGFSKFGAAALVGTMYAESKFNPEAINPNGGASGLIQWLGPRKKALQDKYGNSWTSASNQLSFLMDEIKGGYPGGSGLMNATDLGSAMSAEKKFIGWDHDAGRSAFAQKITQQEWFKYKGHIPKTFQKAAISKAIEPEYEYSTPQSNAKKSINLSIDVTNEPMSEQSKIAMGRRLSPGVVAAIDDTLRMSSLYNIGV